jgi:hypothetical protein
MYDAKSGRFCGRDSIKYEDSTNLYAIGLNKILNGLDPSGKSWVPHPKNCIRLACTPLYALIARDVQLVFQYNSFPTHGEDADAIGNNAMLHCTIACMIRDQIPLCSFVWNEREDDPNRLSDQMDLHNNHIGEGVAERGRRSYQSTANCWNGCYRAWHDGELQCIVNNQAATCPPPSPDFPPNRPPRPGI